jgi:hypothetical protein
VPKERAARGPLGKETQSVDGMCAFATSHSMADLAAYCFASFLRVKRARSSPRGVGDSPMLTAQVKRSSPGMDSVYSGPVRPGWALRYSAVCQLFSSVIRRFFAVSAA